MSQRTRVIQLADPGWRANARNLGTMVEPCWTGADRQGELGALFVRHYAAIRGVCEGVRTPGLVVVAAVAERVVATLVLRARPGQVASAIVGRHGSADLCLPDPALALRHLCLLVHEVGAGRVRLGVLDLHTHSGFEDEAGRRLEALEAEGPVFVRCADYALFCFPTGDGAPPGEVWPDQAAAGLACVPARIYLGEREAEPDRWLRRERRAQPAEMEMELEVAGAAGTRAGLAAGTTLVTTRPGLAQLDEAAVAPHELAGELWLASGRGAPRTRFAISEQALGRGVLIGRYARCDTSAGAARADASLSRVHLLLLRLGGEVLAVDTASSNGCRGPDGQPFRVLALEAGQRIALGRHTALEWRPRPRLWC
ncbi:MAG: hypothetical protein IT370_13140 [Deltaproteobacteria bacterium]|nr:hypothetical protein [Deltaproteobacteria bacterium]